MMELSNSRDMPTQRPKWRQRRYQVAFLALTAFLVAAICGGFLAARAIQGKLTGNDSTDSMNGTNAAALTPPTVEETTDPSDSPTQSPSMEPSTEPSKEPSTSPSQIPVPTGTPSTTPSLAPSVSPSTSMAPSVNLPQIVGVYVMGDIPYAPWEEEMLMQQIADMTEYTHPTAMFTVHVGDIQKPPRSLCAETGYFATSQYLKAGPLKTFVLAGDNDWADCPNITQGLEFYHKYFDFFENHWLTNATTFPMQVEHNTTFPEMWKFNYNGILFISIQLIDSKNLMTDWEPRMNANIQWILTALKDTELSAVVIFGHGQFGNETKEFFEGILPAFVGDRSSVPVMYIHGDGHKWDLMDKVQSQLNWPSFIDVQVDQGGYADPIIVEFSTDPAVPLLQEHDLQYVFANGLIRIDRQRGRYPLGSDGRPDLTQLQSFPLR